MKCPQCGRDNPTDRGVPVRGPPLPGSRVHVQARAAPRGRLRGRPPGAPACLHAALVEAIGLLHADRLAEQVETLAHHAVRGSLTEKAVTYLRQAGTKAAQGIRPPRIFEVASYHALLACLAANVGYALRRARFSAPRVPVPR
jgi:hypothetical protein